MPIRYLQTFQRSCTARALPLVAAIATAMVAALLLPPAATADSDPRRRFSAGESPDWLRAVGRLVVPGIKLEDGRRRHHIERCSATLVQSHSGRRADTIVTAWHCLEYYEDLSRRIVFQLTDNSGQVLEFEARQLADGGNIEADWAILRLQRAVLPGTAPALAIADTVASAPLLMAGYSRDAGIGMAGQQLSYDPACAVTHQDKTFSDSDCRAYKGASGGAVIQVGSDGSPALTGVISQGDGEGLSRYIPIGIFKRTLLGYL
ncbi:trypsin-like serine peptidase [Parahaliea mediterranea]|uniref:trypsin-like serine peptidase n=1 Tax=Parahaliea mediterranea TaxID=651086 RepID=UPI0013002E7E|nr:trypsin-like peptidase domain-containing protein [Parahaliea mediterranea]